MSHQSTLGMFLPKRLKSALRKILNKPPVIAESESKKEEYCKLLEKQRKRSVPIKGNLSYETPLALKSQVLDAYYEELLQTGFYTLENPYIKVNPYDLAPLTALVLFTTKKPSKVSYVVLGDTPENNFSFETKEATLHRIPILGLYPGKQNQVKMTITRLDGSVYKEKLLMIETAPLPDILENAVIRQQYTVPSAYSMFFVVGGGNCMPFAFDTQGTVRYYLDKLPKGYGVFPLSKGHFLFPEKKILSPGFANPHSAQVHDLDLLGRVYRTYHLEEGMHHDATEIEPEGNLLFCSSSFRNQCEDRVAELDRKTGKQLWTLDMDEILECRLHDWRDWAHVNTVRYYPEDDSLLLCMRNLHSAVKVRKSDKKLLWILGSPKFWKDTPYTDYLLKAKGDVEYCFQPHSAFFLPMDNTIPSDCREMIIFDNHWHKRRKVSFFDDDPNSYVVLYEINEKEGTIKQTKRIACPKSKIRSNGIFEKKSQRIFSMEGFLEPLIDEHISTIREYDARTGKLYNSFLLAQGFYRAWEFNPDIDELTLPLPKNDDYFLTSLLPPKKISTEIWRLKKKNPKVLPKAKEISMVRSEDKLMIFARDHQIQEVYLEGFSGTYQKSYTNTRQENEIFASKYYYVVIELGELPPDKYLIYLEIEEKIYRTKKEFTVNFSN